MISCHKSISIFLEHLLYIPVVLKIILLSYGIEKQEEHNMLGIEVKNGRYGKY